VSTEKATPKTIGYRERERMLAATAKATPKGVRLDLRVYLYPEGHSSIQPGTGGGDGAMADDDLQLIERFASVIRKVKRQSPNVG
jgi:hypothetical protein